MVKKKRGRPKGHMHQTGKSDYKRDKKRTAKKPGKRKSKSGKVYYEYRRNRSDRDRRKRL